VLFPYVLLKHFGDVCVESKGTLRVVDMVKQKAEMQDYSRVPTALEMMYYFMDIETGKYIQFSATVNLRLEFRFSH
jgi:hypothetical protein